MAAAAPIPLLAPVMMFVLLFSYMKAILMFGLAGLLTRAVGDDPFRAVELKIVACPREPSVHHRLL
jgi:hypothetical protein